MEDDEKICPRCAETVKSAALVCRFCNHEFGTPVLASSASSTVPGVTSTPVQVAPTSPKKHNSLLAGCAWIIGIIFVLGVIGSIVSPKSTTQPSSSDASESSSSSAAPAEETQVTAVEFAQAYSANEVAAQKTYGDKALDVTGTVSGVTLDLFSNPIVQMVGVNQFLPVQAKFDKSYGDRLSKLSKGEQVTIRCASITEVISAPMLDDCTIQ